MRLDRAIASAGEGSRKDAGRLIRLGAVRVNGAVVRDVGAQVSPGDEIAVNGREITPRENVYIMLNKPAGYVSALKDNLYPTVMELMPPEIMRFKPSPVGRLDVDVTGLLIITSDGALNHRLASPKWHVDKVYEAELARPLTGEDIERFAAGLELSDFAARPSQLTSLGGCRARLTISEGKFHQVKRMFLAVDNEVRSLNRVMVGGVALDASLGLGDYRELTADEVARLKALVSL